MQLSHLFFVYLLSLIKISCHDVLSRGSGGHGLRNGCFFWEVLISQFLVQSICRLKTSLPCRNFGNVKSTIAGLQWRGAHVNL